ncbi:MULTISPECIES: DM13 domain-containing protein [unclassified Imperialibacter]|uniref:DM13 domain-containing protein n=1 Tax=unclassified Imperialibacter TaxID=2629706 RepID=UPI001251F638|nr:MULTISPECIES: DM13 domain-containing protein [unclassified Imperialibacter]CAD5253862.1 conserved hypothetical protein [Imperialibacter sp. 75]CAD5262217.1 conserved hypothetical protein [Imperialibacter sp. 89]VVT35211.1 conserved hypothetical protein [Imperialibacter sp. EC-SDR9]
MSLIQRFIAFSTLSALMISCIGTDLVEDTVSSVEIFSPQAFLNVNESLQMTASGVNEFGDRFDVSTTWQSSDPTVATVDLNGIVFGVARGQVTITASYGGQASKGLQLNVIDLANEVAYIKITGEAMRVEAGESVDLNAFVYNSADVTIDDIEVTWSSTDPAIASVDNEGLVLGVADGTTNIIASADGVNSEPYQIIVGGEFGVRTGSFVGKGGYNVSGDVRVSILDSNALQVSLQDNFNSNNGPGLFVYLSNQDNSVAGGKELAALASTTGPSSYRADGVAIDDYKYVIILCKPFNVVFGLAELN